MMSDQQKEQERWKRAGATFTEHPLLTLYYFLRSATEHFVHPSPDVLLPGRLDFSGDYWVLAVLWGGLLVLAYVGWHAAYYDPTARAWLLGLCVVSVVLTITSGLCFRGGSRYRVALELIIPLLAASGFSRIIFRRG